MSSRPITADGILASLETRRVPMLAIDTEEPVTADEFAGHVLWQLCLDPPPPAPFNPPRIAPSFGCWLTCPACGEVLRAGANGVISCPRCLAAHAGSERRCSCGADESTTWLVETPAGLRCTTCLPEPPR